MMNELKRHQDIVLAVAACFFIAWLIGLYIWGVNRIVAEVNASLEVRSSGGTGVEIDIATAKRLFDAP